MAPLTDETLDALTTTITGNPAWGEEDGSTLPDYLVYANEWAETVTAPSAATRPVTTRSPWSWARP